MAAAYGAMVAVFRHGCGAALIGTRAPGAIESWIPLFVFVVLFGLSMDYNVFVVSRIKEAHDRGMATSQAVAHGIRTTAGVVTSAAIIMVALFAVFGTLSLQQFERLTSASPICWGAAPDHRQQLAERLHRPADRTVLRRAVTVMERIDLPGRAAQRPRRGAVGGGCTRRPS